MIIRVLIIELSVVLVVFVVLLYTYTYAMSELPRRIFHICSGLVVPIAGLLARYDIFVVVLIIVTALAVIIDLLRLKLVKLNLLFIHFARPLMRRGEMHRINGSTYFLIASTIAFLVFGEHIGATALIFLAIGDPAAGIIGSRWGRIRIGQKTLEGSIAFLLTAFVAGALLTGITHIPLHLIALGALVAAVVELLPLPLNDNLTIPLASGAVIMGLTHFLSR